MQKMVHATSSIFASRIKHKEDAMSAKPGFIWKHRSQPILPLGLDAKKSSAGFRAVPHTLKRLLLIATCLVLLLGAGAAGYWRGLGDGSTMARGSAPFSRIPIDSRQLCVALAPLTPSPAVLAAVGAENPKRLMEAQRLMDAEALTALCTDLAGLYPLSYKVAPAQELPDGFFDFQRKQYRLDQILTWLCQRHQPGNFREIGVLPVDVYAPGYNFLFGQAKLAGSTCVASTARMSQSTGIAFKAPAQRWRALVRHELGHTLGLQHTRERSVMRYSNTLNGLDAESVTLTKTDWARLKQLHPIIWK
jgi:archaemetzincin